MRKRWQPEEDARLITLAERLGFKEAARVLGVSHQAAKSRAEHLGLKIGRRRAYLSVKRGGPFSASLRRRPEDAW